MSYSLAPKQRLLWILLPMLATFACQRLFLHLGGARHIYPAGYLLHHLFMGVLILIPAAFTLAFGPRRRASALTALAALGIGAAMVLDEITFLVATQATDSDYVSTLSLGGALILIFGHGISLRALSLKLISY